MHEQGVDEAGIDPRILQSSTPLARLALCAARLQADARFAWIVLVPMRPGLRELEELAPSDRIRLLDEVVLAGRAARGVGEALGRPVEKLNVGALGNVTPQLHIHVVGRWAGDAAWPGPVWGQGEAVEYGPAELERARSAALSALSRSHTAPHHPEK